MIKKIGAPRPPKKDGAIKFQYGRFEGDYDFLVLFGNDTLRCDRALVMHHFTAKKQRYDYKLNQPVFDDSFIDELEKRGYDTKTLKFSIEKKAKS